MATYEQLVQAARQADAAGDATAAKRFLELALQARQAPEPNTNPGVSSDAPPDMIFNPSTGQYTSRELLSGAMAKDMSAAGAFVAGGGQGVTLGGMDEVIGGLNAIVPGQGTMAERNTFGREATRAQAEAAREAHPAAALAGEVIGAVALPTPGVGAGSLPVRAAKGAATGVALGGTYGFLSGEGGLKNRAENAKDVGLLSGAIGGALPLVGELARRGVRAVAGRGAQAQAAAQVPSVETLKAQAGQLYEAARTNGIRASQGETGTLARTIRDIATDEGLITPSGRVAESFPKLRDALHMVDDFAKGTMDPRQMQAVRRTLQAAAGSADGSERRIGTMMLKTFDDWVEPLAPQFKVANELYRRAMGGEMIDRTIELAGSKAGQFSGSGFENALRTEFRALERQIIKGQIKGLSPDQVSAISRVARGGPVENLMRDLGKAAPRGVVSTGLAGGVPFAVGNAAGGPVAGAVAAGGTLAAGEVGRRVATSMQTKNAALASALMRTGGQLPTLPPAYGSAATDSVVRGLLASDPVIASRMQGLLSQ